MASASAPCQHGSGEGEERRFPMSFPGGPASPAPARIVVELGTFSPMPTEASVPPASWPTRSF